MISVGSIVTPTQTALHKFAGNEPEIGEDGVARFHREVTPGQRFFVDGFDGNLVRCDPIAVGMLVMIPLDELELWN